MLAKPRRAATVAIALLAVMGIGAGILAQKYDATRVRLARDELAAGERDVDLRPEPAIEHYRAALALDRDNPAIRRALAVALFGLGKSDEAETHLIELLQLDPIDAEANLLRARIAVRREAYRDAETFYERAIYGRWGATGRGGESAPLGGGVVRGVLSGGAEARGGESAAAGGVAAESSAMEDAAEKRVAARLELADLLSRTGARMQARAELLRLEAESPDTPALQRELARRFMALGDPTQAAELLQREMKVHPSDGEAAKGLADAWLALGRFGDAREAALHALALDPRDKTTRMRVDQINDALSINPALRGLSPASRMRRSGELLARVLQDVRACVAGPSAAAGSPAGGSAAAGSPGAARSQAAESPAAGSPAAGIPAVAGSQAAPMDWRDLEARAQSALAAKPVVSGLAGGAGAAAVSAAPASGAAASAAPASAAAGSREGAREKGRARKGGQTREDRQSREAEAIDAVTDQRLAIVDELWRLRMRQCGGSEGPVAWVMEHLGH